MDAGESKLVLASGLNKLRVAISSLQYCFLSFNDIDLATTRQPRMMA